VSLSFPASLTYRREQLGIEASQTGKIFSVDFVISAGVFIDQTQLVGIGNDDLMANVL
jgi:hypothetical protein